MESLHSQLNPPHVEGHCALLRTEREVSVSNGYSVTEVWEIIQEVSFETSKQVQKC